ncbi:BppU family phage baseplate upper protein [Clostridium perfringens]
MKEIFINVDSYNNEGIKTIQGNNNAEIYKICISKSKVRLSLVGKTVKFGYVMAGTTKGDIIEDLNISNAEQGEITFPITNKISKKDGVYTCQLAIYGTDGFLEYTATFGLTVQANIFTKIAEEITDTKDLTYIERILEEATNISEELKSNIPVARQLNIDLENQNRILNENMDRANGVNTTLITTTEQSKVAATDAIEKKSQLESSITKAKEFIDGLDGSQNIPGIRMELTELQNGLKSNQALEYQGSSVTANDTLEGRTEGMRISGRTLKNEFDLRSVSPNSQVTVSNGIVSWTTGASNNILSYKTMKLEDKQKYTLICNVYENTLTPMVGNSFRLIRGENYGSAVYLPAGFTTGIFKTTFTVDSSQATQWQGEVSNFFTTGTEGKIKFSLMIIKGDVNSIREYFEGIKSFGEAEQEGDKYKISILSSGKNIFKPDRIRTNHNSISFTNKDDVITIEGEANSLNWGAVEIYQFLKKGEWTFSYKASGNGYLRMVIYDAETLKSISSDVYPDRGRSFTNDRDRKILIKAFLKGESANSKLINKYWNIQLEEGTQVTQYEPYKCDKKDILIKEPLNSLPIGVLDILEENNGQVKINRNVKQFTITDAFNDIKALPSNEKFITFQILLSDMLADNSYSNLDVARNSMCSNFKWIKRAWDLTDVDSKDLEGYSVSNINGSFYIKILKSKLTTPDVNGFKAWLKDNPTKIIYQLATPTVEVVENCVDIDLDTYQEKTYFNILNSLPGTLDFKVPSNIGSLVQSNAKEINNINEFINNFILKALLEMNKDLAAIKIKNGLN